MSLFNEGNEKLIEINQPQAFPLLPRRAFLRKSLLAGAGASLLASAGAVGLELLGTLPVAAAPAGQLHVVGVDTYAPNDLWHTIRYANGTWVPQFGNINQQEGNGGSISFFDVSCASDSNGNLHVVGVDYNNATLWHTIRYTTNGVWQSFFDNINVQESNGGSRSFRAVGVA